MIYSPPAFKFLVGREKYLFGNPGPVGNQEVVL
jgi:hypothetical protein